jgi:class 3 adenylate cyclase
MESGAYRFILIISMIVAVALLHFIPVTGQWGEHYLHREFFFFPLFLAAFWFGAKGGLAAAMSIGFIYALYFVVHRQHTGDMVTVGTQVLVFVAVGGMLGWMVDRQERRRRERDFIKATFGQYLPEELHGEVLGGRIPLDGEFKDVTVLFADLRDFTPLVEKTAPKTVVRIINRYFEEMSEAVRNQGGLVLQFIGDEIEAVFGAPISTNGHADMAVRAALEMRQRLVRLNHELKENGLKPLRHGIGIHTGRVLAGNIGSPEFLSYALVGKTVNLAARIQELNKHFESDILMSADTRSALITPLAAIQEQPLYVKGVEQMVTVYRLPPGDSAGNHKGPVHDKNQKKH